MIKYTPHHGAHRADRPKARLLTGLGLAGGLAALVLAGSVSPASATDAAPVSGVWTSAPPQVLVSSESNTVVSNVYQTAVRAPINADGSSNFNAKRGVIPVQFDLLAGTSAVTTTTKTYTPFIWESVAGDVSTTNDYAAASFRPTTPIPLADLNLSAVYDFLDGSNGGGSLRWTVSLDWTGDGTADGTVDVFYGTYPNFVDDGTQSGVNMRTLTDLRVDTTQAGGTFYDNWDGLTTLHPTATVTRAGLYMDGGWKQDGNVQRANVSGVQVNGNIFAPKPNSDVVVGEPVLSPIAKTCTLPAASIAISKIGTSTTGAINEAESIQPKDTGLAFRQVDCKYMYNLDVSSLTGTGRYSVGAVVGTTPATGSVLFELK
jgi:hypothetical protein